MDGIENLPEKQKTDSAFSELYKPSMQIDQNKRREELLKEQKSRRNKLLDSARGIVTESCEKLEKSDASSDSGSSVNSSKSKKYNHNKYYHKLMFSEWFIDVPSDFDVSWFMKICPEGHRNLVVSRANKTESFSKYGHLECRFNSALPYGHKATQTTKWKTTMLDCIWSSRTKKFYVLDVIIWEDFDLTEHDAEFRFYWLQSKMSESPELEQISTLNAYPLELVSHNTCDFQLLKEELSQYPFYENNKPSVDGLLFYHKEASYTSGRTPLVGWLKPYMIPELLNIPVAQEYEAKKPKKYINLKKHLEYAELKRKEKRKSLDPEAAMEVS